jgi:hypothetical protein
MAYWKKLLPAILFLLVATLTGVPCVVDFVGGWPVSTMRVVAAFGALVVGLTFLGQVIAMHLSAHRRRRQ